MLEPVERSGHVLLDDVPVHAGQLADGLDHLLRRGLAVAEVPDGEGCVVEEVDRGGFRIVQGVLVAGLTEPGPCLAGRTVVSNRGAHWITSTGSSNRPYWTKAAASNRECTPSLVRMFCTCVRAVCRLMTRARAIPSLSAPSARSLRTSRSRRVSRARRCRASFSSRCRDRKSTRLNSSHMS